MNKIINTFLLTGDKFMTELHLKQPGLTYSACILKHRADKIARNCKYDGYHGALASMVHKFFNKKTESGINVNEQLTEELHQPVIKKIKRRKVYARCKDNIWAADFADTRSLS